MLANEDSFAAVFKRAISLHERTPDAFEAARTRLAFGQPLRRPRNRVLAREQLRTAVDDSTDSVPGPGPTVPGRNSRPRVKRASGVTGPASTT